MTFVFILANGTVSWRSMLWGVIDLSNINLQYIAVIEAVKETLWPGGLIGNLGVTPKNVEVHCDKQSAIHLSKNQFHHGMTKHIDVLFHFIREIIEHGEVILKKIGIKDNLVDMMTKVVPMTKFEHHSTLVNVLRY